MIVLNVDNYNIWGVDGPPKDWSNPENLCENMTSFSDWEGADAWCLTLDWPASKVLKWLDETMKGRWVFGCRYPSNEEDISSRGLSYDVSEVIAFWHESDAMLFKLTWG